MISKSIEKKIKTILEITKFDTKKQDMTKKQDVKTQ